MNTPTNSDDVIDSRDIIARLEELQGEREALAETITDATDDTSALSREDIEEARKALEEWDADNSEELKTLTALADEGANSADDWRHGVTLIRDSYFERYAQEFADDIGAVNADAAWPNNCIDWERAANELQTDYSSIEFDGVTYWVR